MYKIEDFEKQEIDEEIIFVHKLNKNKWFGRFPDEETYYIPHHYHRTFNTKQEAINQLNKQMDNDLR